MIHHNLVVKGPLFPLFPEGWVGPLAPQHGGLLMLGAGGSE